MKQEIIELFPGRVYGKKEVTTTLPTTATAKSSIRARVRIPVLNTFTLCFWIRTKDDFAQIFAVIYNNSWNRARIDVSIRRGKLVLHLDGTER
jgi:aldehyde:ferredoxin oxidoreductase